MRRIFASLCLLPLLLAACQPAPPLVELEPPTPQTASPTVPTTVPSPTPAAPTPAMPLEAPVQLIRLKGPAAQAQAEISGLTWAGDTLLLIPQFPNRFDSPTGAAFFGLHKADLLAYLDQPHSGDSSPPALEPFAIPIDLGGLEETVRGFEGFEAAAVTGDRIYLTIEARARDAMQGYLVAGTLAPGLSEIRLDPATLVTNPPQVGRDNSSDEALLVWDDRLVSLFELNGARINPDPVGHVFDLDLNFEQELPFPPLEFRVTDATPPDAQCNFWVINYFFPFDLDLATETDPLAERWGKGYTHSSVTVVERLVELQISAAGIHLVDRPPIQLELFVAGGTTRNWEGIVRLDERGFLLATDKFPGTLLGFVSLEGFNGE